MVDSQETCSMTPRAPAIFRATRSRSRPPAAAVRSLPTLPPPHCQPLRLFQCSSHHPNPTTTAHPQPKQGEITRGHDSHQRRAATQCAGQAQGGSPAIFSDPQHYPRALTRPRPRLRSEDRWWAAAGGGALLRRRRWGGGAWSSWPWPPRSGSPAPPSTGATRRGSPPRPLPPRRCPPPPLARPAAATARRPSPSSPSPQGLPTSQQQIVEKMTLNLPKKWRSNL